MYLHLLKVNCVNCIETVMCNIFQKFSYVSILRKVIIFLIDGRILKFLTIFTMYDPINQATKVVYWISNHIGILSKGLFFVPFNIHFDLKDLKKFFNITLDLFSRVGYLKLEPKFQSTLLQNSYFTISFDFDLYYCLLLLLIRWTIR